MNALKLACSLGFTSIIRRSFLPDVPGSDRHMSGLHFRNPVGLGAGFDKNARYLRELEALGFGFVEIGTVTPLPQDGNRKPRLFRLRHDNALINRMGFNNEGVQAVAARLKKWRIKHPATDTPGRMIIGGNIGKNKITPNEEAWKDYDFCFRELHPYVDYFVVNVSSPNTPGLRELQQKESLRKILMHLQMINNAKAIARPVFLKIAPDLSQEDLADIVDLAIEIKLDGLVATNTTLSREGLSGLSAKIEGETGGLSGLPLKGKSTDVLKFIHAKSGSQFTVIASGGIFTAGDANEKISAGATLVQVWTGFIYEGPSIVKRICRGLNPNQL